MNYDSKLYKAENIYLGPTNISGNCFAKKPMKALSINELKTDEKSPKLFFEVSLECLCQITLPETKHCNLRRRHVTQSD